MTLRWERFAGDTSAFAVKVSFHHDPDRGHGASHDVAQSWGALQLWVRGTNLCSHVDQGEALQAAHWYLLPILEWFAANWDPILHEQRPPSGMQSIVAATDVSSARMASESWSGPASLEAMESRYEWQQRHSLRSARDGGILPDVRFRRLADRVEISWRDSPLAGAEEISFVSAEDVAYEAPSAVAEPLYEVLHSAATWLRQQVPESERTAALLETVKAIRSPDRANGRTAWLAGLASNGRSMVDRWSALKDTLRPQIDADVFDVVFGTGRSSDVVISGSCEAALLFGSLDPKITDDDAVQIAQVLLETYAQNARDGLADLVVDESIDPLRRPWEQGYELADDLLDDANLSTNGSSTDIEAFLVGRGVQILDEDLSDRNLRAISLVSPHHPPTITLNRLFRYESDPVRRFTLAHELCHLLYDRSYGIRLAIASGPWAPKAIEQRANAFAAWLLMPPHLVKAAIAAASAPIASAHGITEVAQRLEVSRIALVDHLHNLGLLDEVERSELRFGDAQE